MIVGRLEDAAGVGDAYGRAIREALEYIRRCDFASMALGRHEIDGSDMYAVLSEGTTSPGDRLRAESHFEYTDVHYVVAGEERIGYAPRTPEQYAVQELSDQDAVLYDKLSDECFLPLREGGFAVFFPRDIHRPWCCGEEPGPLRKLVIKIHRNRFEGE